jgi:hypothetical protein
MGQMLDWLAAGLLFGAAGSFAFGIHVLAGEEDALALYLFAIGALSLKSSIDLLRPRKSP